MMFFKHSNDGKTVVLIVYMDDIIITGDVHLEIKKLKMLLA